MTLNIVFSVVQSPQPFKLDHFNMATYERNHSSTQLFLKQTTKFLHIKSFDRGLYTSNNEFRSIPAIHIMIIFNHFQERVENSRPLGLPFIP